MFQHATLHHSQLRRGLLHRRQRPRPAVDRPPGRARPEDSPQFQRLATTYAAFLNAAFDRELGRFRNFLGFDRRWLEEVGSDDCHGRALWALGACVGRSRRRDLQFWAAANLRAGPARRSRRRPRPGPGPSACWASTNTSAGLAGDRLAAQVRDTLTDPADRSVRADATPTGPGSRTS